MEFISNGNRWIFTFYPFQIHSFKSKNQLTVKHQIYYKQQQQQKTIINHVNVVIIIDDVRIRSIQQNDRFHCENYVTRKPASEPIEICSTPETPIVTI